MSSGLGRRFWTLWSAFSASNLGDGLTLVGFPLLAVELTDDARLVTLVAAVRILPFFLVALPAGVVIDRFDRRLVAIVAQCVRAVALTVVGVAALVGSASITLLVVCAFVVGIGEVMFDGGLPAIVRDVVVTDNLETANSRMRASETVSNAFIGPPAGALLFQFGWSVPFLVAAGVYALTIGLLGLLPGNFVPEPDPDGGTFLVQMKRGLTYVWGHPILRPLALAVAAFTFVSEAANATFVLLVTERLGLDGVYFGLLIAVDATVSVAVSFAVTWLVRRTSHATSMKLAVTAYTVQMFLLGSVTFIPFILVALAFGGLSDPTWSVITATVRQRLVDDHIFGRMMTAYLFIGWSLRPFGAILGGVISEAYGPEWVYIMGGVVMGSLLFFARPLFRRIDLAMACHRD